MPFSRTASILLTLMLTACASHEPQSDSTFSCAPAVAGCKKIGGACAMLRFTQNGVCDASCQNAVKKKIRSAGVSILHETKRPTPDKAGCVDYREDIGGTAEGAQCLALLTGYEFHHGDCKTDGWAYSIIVP